MLKNLIFCCSVIALFVACNTGKTPSNATVPNDGKHFGKMVDAKKTISYETLLTKMEKVDSLNAKVTGKVSAVCLKKGCWMTMISDKPGQPDMRITFKDYAFFMPKDIVGKSVVIDGFARVETTPIDVLRHFAEDAGKTKEEIAAINKPKRELAFEAAGVLIME
jgi:hypothetical protein